MKCGKPANVSLILVGLHSVGVVGLRDAIRKVDNEGPAELDAIVDSIIACIAEENYVPDSQVRAFRQAIAREYLRHHGRDFRDHYSEVEVTVSGTDGEELERFVETLTSVFGDFELRPAITRLPSAGEDPTPELRIGEETVVRGCLPRPDFKAAVRRRISDW